MIPIFHMKRPANNHSTNFRNTVLLILFAILILPLAGCLGFGYQAGSQSLFGQDIKTVYVPIFKSNDSHSDLAERLTEAVCKRIEARSPYKVVGRPTADSTLDGRIVSRSRCATLTNDFDDPRQMLETITVEVNWIDRRDRSLREFDSLTWNSGHGTISASSYTYAELGQSQATQEQQEIERIADQIVGMMELPW